MILLLLHEGGPATYIINKFFQNYTSYLPVLLQSMGFLIESENKLEKTAEKDTSTLEVWWKSMFHCDALKRKKRGGNKKYNGFSPA